MQVDNCVKDLSRKIGRSPSVHEIGTALNLTTEQVLEAMEAASAYDAVSLESYRFGDEGDGETYAESIGVEDERFELVEYGATIAPTLQRSPRATASCCTSGSSRTSRRPRSRTASASPRCTCRA